MLRRFVTHVKFLGEGITLNYGPGPALDQNFFTLEGSKSLQQSSRLFQVVAVWKQNTGVRLGLYFIYEYQNRQGIFRILYMPG